MTDEWPHEGLDPYHRPLGDVIRGFELRLRRQDVAIRTLATSLVALSEGRLSDAQDARGIEKILDGGQ